MIYIQCYDIIHTRVQYGEISNEKANNIYYFGANSLLAENISKVNALLKGKCVKSVSISKWKDMVLTFDDGIEIQVMPDCLERNFEYYRFIEFVPHYNDDPKRYKSIHYSVINDNGQPRELRS